MNMHAALGLVPLALLATAVGQQPQYQVSPVVRPGAILQSTLLAPPNAPFASLIDLGGGPRRVSGEDFYLDLGAALTVVDSGLMPSSGLRQLTFGAPSNIPLGVPLYWQSVVIDPTAPNGVYRVSDGESTVAYGSMGVLFEDFVDPVSQGYTGDYDQGKSGRLQGAAARTRTQRTIPGGVRFGQPVSTPLNAFGVRAQMVLRPGDLGAAGDEELVTAVRWMPFGGVVSDTFSDLSLELAHSGVSPDFTIDPFSALPRFPNSGLDLTFANNIRQGQALVRIYRGPYAISPADQRADGYMPYPAPQTLFAYNGIDSLLLDFKMSPSNAAGVNGQVVYLQVQSSQRPNARAYDVGTAASPVNPYASVLAQDGDNAMHDLQLELTKVLSTALSPWRDSGFIAPDYHPAALAQSVPAGTSITVEYRGSALPSGGNPTPWSTNIDAADGQRFLQMRISLRAAPAGGGVPSLDAIVIPIN